MTDTIGPPSLFDELIFNAFIKKGLVTNVQAPRYMKCRLNSGAVSNLSQEIPFQKLTRTSASSLGDSGMLPDLICC